MGKKVIIAEKPSVAKEFAKVLKINGKNNLENAKKILSGI